MGNLQFEFCTLSVKLKSMFAQRQLVVNLLGMTDTDIFYENLKQRLADQIGVSPEGLENLGLLQDTPVVKKGSPLDTLSHYLAQRLAFGKFYRQLSNFYFFIKHNEN